MTVHNHGTEEGAGLACREIRLHSGLKGECMLDPVVMNFLGQLGDEFWRIRESKNLSQKEAAKVVNNTQSKISYVERGAMDMKLSTLISLAHGYGKRVVIHFEDLEQPDGGTEDDGGDESASPRRADSGVQRPRSERPVRPGSSRTDANHRSARRARAARRADSDDSTWVPPKPLGPTLLEKFGMRH